MPVSNITPIAVDTTAKLITGTTSGEEQVLVFQCDVAWFIGGPSVTAANGVSVQANERVVANLGAGDKYYCILASGTGTMRVMKTRS